MIILDVGFITFHRNINNCVVRYLVKFVEFISRSPTRNLYDTTERFLRSVGRKHVRHQKYKSLESERLEHLRSFPLKIIGYTEYFPCNKKAENTIKWEGTKSNDGFHIRQRKRKNIESNLISF
jgi:hypothetical protein